MEAYEKLREKLDLFPIGLPRDEVTMKILRLLFTPDEAAAAAGVPNLPLLASAKKIARKSGMPLQKTGRLLAGLASKGLIIDQDLLGEKRYALMPAVPGFMEMQFMLNQEIDENRREAGRLWHEALEGAFGEENYGYPTSGVRVVPVRKSVSGGQRVYNFEEVEKILRSSGDIAITECACRKSAGKCDAPLDVCMMLGVMANYLADRGLARKVTLREAIKTLERAADAGLIHTTTNCRPPVSIICSCCSCCCASLRGVVSLNKPASTVSSNFKCEPVNGADCKLCRACEKACRMGAISIADEQVVVDADRCIGCGVCVRKCKTNSLHMVRVSKKAPEATSLHLSMKMIEERGKLPDIVKNVVKDIL